MIKQKKFEILLCALSNLLDSINSIKLIWPCISGLILSNSDCFIFLKISYLYLIWNMKKYVWFSFIIKKLILCEGLHYSSFFVAQNIFKSSESFLQKIFTKHIYICKYHFLTNWRVLCQLHSSNFLIVSNWQVSLIRPHHRLASILAAFLEHRDAFSITFVHHVQNFSEKKLQNQHLFLRFA